MEHGFDCGSEKHGNLLIWPRSKQLIVLRGPNVPLWVKNVNSEPQSA